MISMLYQDLQIIQSKFGIFIKKIVKRYSGTIVKSRLFLHLKKDIG